MTRSLRCIGPVLALALAGCGAPVAVIIDLVTDWEPGVEFDAVRTTLTDEDGRSLGERTRPVAMDDAFTSGARVAELADVPRGVHTLEVALLSGPDVVARRQRTVAVSSTIAVTVELLRPACAPGPELCNGRDDDCDRAIDEDPGACALPGVDGASCVDGACVIDACAGGRDDCDGDAENGCEADLASDAAHCGACGTGCDEGDVCERGVCRGRGRYVAHTTSDSTFGLGLYPRPGGGFFNVSNPDINTLALDALDGELTVEWSSVLATSTGYAPSGFYRARADGGLTVSLSLLPGVTFGESATHDFGAGPVTVTSGTSRSVLVVYDDAGAYVEHRWLPGSELASTSTSSAWLWDVDDDGGCFIGGYVSMGAMVDPGDGSIAGEARYVAAYDAAHTLRWSHVATPSDANDGWSLVRACPDGDSLAVFTSAYTAVHDADFGAGPTPISADVQIAVRYASNGDVRWYRAHRGRSVAFECLDDGRSLGLLEAPFEGGGGIVVERRTPDGLLDSEHELPFRDYTEDELMPGELVCRSTCARISTVAVSPWGDLDFLVGVSLPVDFGGGRRAPVFDGLVLASYAPDGTYRYDHLYADPGTMPYGRLAVSGRDLAVEASYVGEIDLGSASLEGDGWARVHLRD